MQPHLTAEDISNTITEEYSYLMKTVQLTPQIKYVHLSDEDGSFGLMINQSTSEVVEIHNDKDFEFWFNAYNGDVE